MYLSFIARRLLQTIPTLLGIITALFLVLYLAPGDPIMFLLGTYYTDDAYEALASKYGLDRPLPIQYFDYIYRVVQGDFGMSMRSSIPAFPNAIRYLRSSLELALAALIFIAIAGTILGAVSALAPGGRLDRVIMFISLGVYSVPVFVAGSILLYTLAFRAQLFPIGGRGEPSQPLDILWHLVLPTITLGIRQTALVARILRSKLIDILSNRPYIVTARAKGLGEMKVVVKHAFRNAMIPVVTVLALNLGALIGNAAITEVVFNRVGLGSLLLQSVHARDYPQVQAAAFLFCMVVIIANLLADVAYGLLDPRIRYE